MQRRRLTSWLLAAVLVTSAPVLLECGNAAAKRPYRLAVERLRERTTRKGCLIVPTDEDWNSAWLAYARGESANAGVVDQLSFVLMRRMGITEAFTNDRHFQAAGFITLF